MENTPRKELISSINITPFTDVILVLLIIFMISVPGIYVSSLSIKLPKGSGVSEHPPEAEIVGIDKQGNLYFQNKKVTAEELQKYLSGRQEEKKKSVIIIQADEEAKHGDVVNVLNLLKELDYGQVFIGVAK